MRRPRLNILRTFEAAGRYLSFSLTADDLKVSQAAVSQQMRQLEAYLKTPLFVRHHRRLSLTSIGQAYLEAVHEALDRLDSVTDRLFPGRQNQTVTLRCTSVVAILWLAPQLVSLQKRHPNIDLRINTRDQGY
ncbi:MAG: LysR family transcriptional regulator, partial [Proteobacteria bacterium]|nr:LysR family transcriptional regulator [Pseudomonadota bacterium]